MEIGINLQMNVDLPLQVKLLRKLGVRHTFFSSEWDKLNEAVALCRENEIIIDTLHAPYNRINDMWLDDESGDKMLSRLIDAVEKCHQNSIPVVIVHLSS